jgi:cytochrome P450
MCGLPPAAEDFLNAFLSACDTNGSGVGPGMSKAGAALISKLGAEKVVDNALRFTAAGHATSSAATCWLLFHLATHLSTQEALHDELTAAFSDRIGDDDYEEKEDEGGEDGGEEAEREEEEGEDEEGNILDSGYDDARTRSGDENAWRTLLDALARLDVTVCESLPLTPGINMTAREATADPTIGGVALLAGLVVSIPMQALQHCKREWGADTAAFPPARWLDGSSSSARGAWLRFLTGARSCVGIRVAVLQIKTVAAAVLLASLRPRVAYGVDPAAAGVVLVMSGLRLPVDLVRKGGTSPGGA